MTTQPILRAPRVPTAAWRGNAERITPSETRTKTFYEFFAGGGMARAGLGADWRCSFANDFDVKKVAVYTENWGSSELYACDVNALNSDVLPGRADLAWASFPCQDLSLAGKYAGIGEPESREQTRSGAFWGFWRLIKQLAAERRAPRIVALENVTGAMTSSEGADFRALCRALHEADYRFGALVIDAKHFVPQSRPRLFFVALRSSMTVPLSCRSTDACSEWHPEALRMAFSSLSASQQDRWVWWRPEKPTSIPPRFMDIVDAEVQDFMWHTRDQTARLISMMSELNIQKLEVAKQSGKRVVGSIYKRTRVHNGQRKQRAEVRFDGVAGCLRTPRGGSSRQIIIVVEGEAVRTRLLSPREAARLMGLPDGYWLPKRYNDAYHIAGDGVAVPVVRYLADQVINPIIHANTE